jgi:hypothetical protein
MVFEFIFLYLIILLILKKTLFPRVSTMAIIVMTCVLTMLMAAAAAGAPKRPRVERFVDEGLKYLGGLSDSPTQPMPSLTPATPVPAQGVTANASPPIQSVAVQHALTENVDVIDKMLKSASSGGKLHFYYSVYSPISYSPNSLFWNSLIDAAVALQFSDVPAKTAGDMALLQGLPLNLNSITGPPSSDVGFSAKGQYTIFMQMKFAKPLATSFPADVLSLFSASTSSMSTAGLIFRLTEGSAGGAVSTAKMSVIVSNNTTLQCSANGTEHIALDDHLSYCFVIVKYPTQLKMFMCSSIKKEPMSIIDAEDLKMPDDFINLPMTINSTKNIEAKLMAFGGYNTVLEQADVRTVCDYLFDREREAFDPDYVAALKKIKSIEEAYQKMTKCPFTPGAPDGVCKTCVGIKNWGSFDESTSANMECMKSIADHCSKGDAEARKSGICACWDDKNPRYASIPCINIRAAFVGEKKYDIGNLDALALVTVKNIYGDQICPPKTKEDNTPPGKPPGANGELANTALPPMPRMNPPSAGVVLPSSENPIFSASPSHIRQPPHSRVHHRQRTRKMKRKEPGMFENFMLFIEDTIESIFGGKRK